MSSVAATVLPKQASVTTYGLVLFLLGLAVIFLINRVKLIDQRQRMLEMQHQNDKLTEEHVHDIVYHMISDETLVPKCSCRGGQCCVEPAEPEPEVEVTPPPVATKPAAPKKTARKSIKPAAVAPSQTPAKVEVEEPTL
jgi:Na+-transporting NADH:ubiquinone oxidoreductase subunit NqrF